MCGNLEPYGTLKLYVRKQKQLNVIMRKGTIKSKYIKALYLHHKLVSNLYNNPKNKNIDSVRLNLSQVIVIAIDATFQRQVR